MTIHSIADKVRTGARIDAGEALSLYRDAPTTLLGQLAEAVRERKHPERIVSYIIDRNVNYTNVCVAKCNFCAFYRPVGSAEGYVLGFDELFRKIDETIAVGGVQLLLQGGHNPDLPLSWYEDLFRAIKDRYPSFKLHALSPPEVIHLSRLSQLPVPQVLERLIAAGLDSVPGGGAEILVDRVRTLLHCVRQGHRRRVARRHAARPPRGSPHDGHHDVRNGRDRRRADRASAATARDCRTRPAASRRSSRGAINPITPSSPAPKRPASTTCERWRCPGSCSTTSTICRRRG